MKKLHFLLFLLTLTLSVTAQNVHVVQRGETEESIAQKYGVTAEQLKEANPYLQTFYTGAKVVIPQITHEIPQSKRDEEIKVEPAAATVEPKVEATPSRNKVSEITESHSSAANYEEWRAQQDAEKKAKRLKRRAIWAAIGMGLAATADIGLSIATKEVGMPMTYAAAGIITGDRSYVNRSQEETNRMNANLAIQSSSDEYTSNDESVSDGSSSNSQRVDDIIVRLESQRRDMQSRINRMQSSGRMSQADQQAIRSWERTIQEWDGKIRYWRNYKANGHEYVSTSEAKASNNKLVGLNSQASKSQTAATKTLLNHDMDNTYHKYETMLINMNAGTGQYINGYTSSEVHKIQDEMRRIRRDCPNINKSEWEDWNGVMGSK